MPKRARESFAFSNEDGTITVVSSDDVYADNHPIVKARKEMFRDISEEPIIEQATAAPGESRNVKR